MVLCHFIYRFVLLFYDILERLFFSVAAAFCCCDYKHWGGIVEGILLFIHSSAHTKIYGNLLHSYFSKLFYVPGRADIGADRKLALDVLALLHQGISKLIVGVIFRKIRGFRKVHSAIIGIEIQKYSAWF